MANNLSLGLVIGGAVSSTLGAAFNSVEGRIKKLEQQGNRAKVLKNTIGETMRLRDEWKKAHDSGSASASGLLRKLETNLDSLKKQGVQVNKLRQEYQSLGNVAKGIDLKVKGHQQVEQGKTGLKSGIGAAVAGVGALAIPTKISADYQAIIRDIAIKAGVANKPQEEQMTRTIIDTSQQTGMGRNDVADLVNQLVGAGMELDKALSYAPVAAKFAIGQGSGGEDTAKMIMALQQNAKIVDPAVMEKALQGIALQGQAGSFEASDMAKWFPQLLASMEKNGSTGLDSVAQLGAMLQVQMKTAGGSDEAANNLKNWIEKIGSGDVVKSYKDAGIDYQASLNTGIQKGMSTLESSFALAQRYVQATNPEQAKKMAEAMAGISKEADPVKAKSMLESLEKSLRTGDLFADMQVKAALTAFSQNKALYEQLKTDAQSATGILDKNLAERRQTSSQIWSETFQALDDSMRSIGDAIRPATDKVAEGIAWVAKGFTGLSDNAKPVVLGITTLGAGLVVLKSVLGAVKIGRGIANIGRGSLMGRSAGKDQLEAGTKNKGFNPVSTGLKVLDQLGGASNDPNGGVSAQPQKVFVVNASAIGGGNGSATDAGGQRRSRRGRRRGGAGARAGGLQPSVASAAPAVAPGRLARLTGAAGKLGGAAKALPGGKILDAGLMALDTFQNAKTQDEKAEGYGGAAGGLGGALAGGAAGAAIGSIVPVIGTAIGGAVGAFLGGMGGESLGGFLAKSWFGSGDKANAPGDVVKAMATASPSPESIPAIAKAAEQNKPAAQKIDQQFTFSPTIPVTVQGDVKDPAQLARELAPYLQRPFEEFSRQASARQLFDQPDVA
ncbi:phage tail tape measure protein [Pseudomonas quasicaspiana]|uniref:phage tail tape measure protein n=1 Tax=Pseudomonas quasicaspiana TaxID=2829821 RepID=UPI001E3E262F|nr:phage tail tape measure protein [Pseudomonas quasicaspiana]MCD5977206.1 phage tail tape measure protein [Pseudomonas quasicaspiana]